MSLLISNIVFNLLYIVASNENISITFLDIKILLWGTIKIPVSVLKIHNRWKTYNMDS